MNDRPLAFADQLSDYATKAETSSVSELSAAFETISAGMGNVYTKNETSSAAEIETALADFALTSQIPTSVSQLDNDSGYVDGTAVQGMLDSYYQKSETSSAAELSSAFANVSVEVDPQLRTDIDNKVLVNEVSAQSLKINIMALSAYAEISGTAAFDPTAFYYISDDTGGGGGGVDPQALSNYYTRSETSSAAELSTAFSAAGGYDLGKTYVKYADGSTAAYNLTGWVNGNLSTTIANPLDAVEVRIGSNVTAFGDDGFRKWTSLTAVYYPDSVASIGQRAFLGDNKLAHVELPDQLTSLGNYMFEDCSALTSLTIPRGAVETTEGTFNRAAGLKELQFPDGFQQVGKAAFTNCVNLKKVVFPASLTSIAGHLYGTRVFDGTTDLTAVFLGKTGEEISAMPNYSQWGGTRLVVSGWIPASQEWVESQIPTSTSQLENDSGYVDQTALENYYTKDEVDAMVGDINSLLEEMN